MIQTQESGKKLHFGPNLGLLDPNSGDQFCFSKIWLRQLLGMVSYHNVQYQEKLITQSSENLVTDRWTDRRTRVISQYTVRLKSNVQKIKKKSKKVENKSSKHTM